MSRLTLYVLHRASLALSNLEVAYCIISGKGFCVPELVCRRCGCLATTSRPTGMCRPYWTDTDQFSETDCLMGYASGLCAPLKFDEANVGACVETGCKALCR